MRQGYTSGKLLLFLIGFPGPDTMPGYALFGAYAVKWIELFKLTVRLLKTFNWRELIGTTILIRISTRQQFL
jgi:hypothetical protein